MVFKGGNHTTLDHTLQALVDRGTRAILAFSYIPQGDTSIVGKTSKDL